MVYPPASANVMNDDGNSWRMWKMKEGYWRGIREDIKEKSALIRQHKIL